MCFDFQSFCECLLRRHATPSRRACKVNLQRLHKQTQLFFSEPRSEAGLLCEHTCTKPMDGGPKSLKAGLKLDDEGRDGEGTEDPGREEVCCEKNAF